MMEFGRFSTIVAGLVLAVPCFTAAAETETGRRLANADLVYRMFDRPLDITEINRHPYIENGDLRDLPDLFDANGYSPDKGFVYEIMWDPDTDDAEFTDGDTVTVSRRLHVTFPQGYVISGSNLSPKTMDIKQFPDSVSVTYTLPGTAAQFESLLADAGVGPEIDEDGNVIAGRYHGFGQHVYCITPPDTDGYLRFSAVMPLPAEYWYSIPSSYYPGKAYLGLPADSPCNSGDEPFNDFISRFNADRGFRLDRVWSSAISNHEERSKNIPEGMLVGFYKIALQAMEECQLLPVHGHTHVQSIDDDGVKYYDRMGCWYYPTADKVIYSTWDTTLPGMEEYDNNSAIVLFERLYGEWNVTSIQYFGQRLDDEVRRLMHN